MATLLSLEMLQNDLAHTIAPRILYVEDDVELAQLFKQQMEHEGFQVDLAHTGVEGLDFLARRPYEMVVIDYLLPELNGLQILRRLTENERHPPAIMVATEDDIPIMVEALRLGIADFVIQDDETDDLHKRLTELVSRVVRQYRRQSEREPIVEDLYGQNRKLALLNRATQIFTSTFDEEDIALRLVSSICEFTDAEGSSVWLVRDDPAGAQLECVAIFARGEHITPRHVALKPDEGLAGWSFSHDEAVTVNDVEQDARFSAASDTKLDFHTRSLLAAPMRAPDKVIGVLELVNKQSGPFTPIDQTLAETLATSAAIAIENARYVHALHRSAEELRLRNEELDAFAHTVAHDLRTPLSIITGYADMLRESIEYLHPDEARTYLQQVIDNGMRMNHIVESLLLLAGVRGAPTVEISPVDMSAVVSEALSRVDFLVKSRKAQVSLPDRWPVVEGFAPWLEEVWYNYIVNALKYGGEPPALTLGYDLLDDEMVRFWVGDNGAGVTEDTSTLFTPTLRLQNTKKRKSYSLGLSIVKRIVERLNGKVGATNLPNGGARFFFTLPAARAAE